MPHYFLLLDASVFHSTLVPALTASWRQRSFTPCVPLCRQLEPRAAEFAEQYRTGPGEPLLAAVVRGLAYDRGLWRAVVGELLWYAATDIPTVRTAPDLLCGLLSPDRHRESPVPRDRFEPIQQAHLGTRDLMFGGHYRPDDAGWNNRDDVRRLAHYLGAIEPEDWTVALLADTPDLEKEERPDELEFARQRFVELREVYTQAARTGQVIVCEVL